MSEPELIQNRYFNKLHSFYLSDLSDARITNTIFEIEKPDIVIHAAHDKDPIKNIQILNNVIDSCNYHNVDKLIFFSTYKVYDYILSEDALPNEDSLTVPQSMFEFSKKACEDLIKLKSNATNIILRLCNIYGIRQSKEFLIPKTINNILNNSPIVLDDRGENIKQWLSLPDFYKMLYKTLYLNNSVTYNVGSNQTYSNVEVVQHICNSMGAGHSLIKLEDTSKDYKILGCDFTKIKKELDFTPDTKLKYDEVLITWYKNNQWFFK
jgi:nucleoside-diphosphate-sugar epimerase